MRRIYNLFADTLENRLNFDARYFMRGGFWLTFGLGFTILAGLVTTALLAHFLNEAQYGVYRYLIGLAVIFSSFSLTGLGQAILQATAQKYQAFYKETLKINWQYSLVISALGTTGALYYWFNENITLAIGCAIIAVLQPIINTYQFVPAYLQGAGKFKETTGLHFVKVSITSLVTVGVLLITQNVLWLFLAYLCSQALANIISNLWYRPGSLTPTPIETFTKYLSYAKHTSVRFLILNASFRADSILIFTQLGAVELAIYTIATVIPEQIKSTFKSLSTLLLPKYAKHGDFQAIKKSIPLRSLQLGIVLSVIAGLYILVAPFIYQLLFPKYEQAVLLSQLLALSFPAMIALIPNSALESQLEERGLYMLNTISSVIMVITTILGILFYGLMGAILAKVAYRYIVLVISYFILCKKDL